MIIFQVMFLNYFDRLERFNRVSNINNVKCQLTVQFISSYIVKLFIISFRKIDTNYVINFYIPDSDLALENAI